MTSFDVTKLKAGDVIYQDGESVCVPKGEHVVSFADGADDLFVTCDGGDCRGARHYLFEDGNLAGFHHAKPEGAA